MPSLRKVLLIVVTNYRPKCSYASNEAGLMKVLVIDDDHLVRYTLSRILQHSGYDVITASDGRRGMLLLREEYPDVVITDIIMPEQEGIDTIIQVRRERPNIKIIAISGGGRIRNIDFLKMAHFLGADNVMRKPFEANELLAQLTELGLGPQRFSETTVQPGG
jgi:DNA-binding response OmpR family regulator